MLFQWRVKYELVHNCLEANLPVSSLAFLINSDQNVTTYLLHIIQNSNKFQSDLFAM